LLDETLPQCLKLEHGVNVWRRAACPARLKTDQELRQRLIEAYRWIRARRGLTKIKHCGELDGRAGKAPRAAVLYQLFLGEDLLENIVMRGLGRILAIAACASAMLVIGTTSPKWTKCAFGLIAGLTAVKPAATVS
jgi:hypothetical protein